MAPAKMAALAAPRLVAIKIIPAKQAAMAAAVVARAELEAQRGLLTALAGKAVLIAVAFLKWAGPMDMPTGGGGAGAATTAVTAAQALEALLSFR
jgi:hypothetical protein